MTTYKNLDSTYFHVYRNGRRQAVCLSDMTTDELKAVLPQLTQAELMHCIISLCSAIQSLASQFDMARDRN